MIRENGTKKNVSYHWDRAFYNGKYYSYFGLAPLFMVYYPVYWLTGMLPTTAFAGFLLAAFAVVMIFAAIQGLMRLFAPRANLLLFPDRGTGCGLRKLPVSDAGFLLQLLLSAAPGRGRMAGRLRRSGQLWRLRLPPAGCRRPSLSLETSPAVRPLRRLSGDVGAFPSKHGSSGRCFRGSSVCASSSEPEA